MIILHSNDVHGELPALLALLGQVRQTHKQAVWVDSGDALRGSNTVFRWHEPILEAMRAQGCLAMAMGNREFNYQRWVLRRRRSERQFPLLCANLRDLRGAEPTADERGFSTWQEHLELDTPEGLVFVVGATVVQYPVGSPWESVFGFRFLDPLSVVPSLAQKAAQRGAAVWVLSHLGLDVDRRLAEDLPSGSLILGGHTHTVLERPEMVNGCWIVQGGAHARFLGLLDYAVAERTLRSYALVAGS